MTDPDRDAPEEAKQLQMRVSAIDGELEQLLLRWEELEKRAA